MLRSKMQLSKIQQLKDNFLGASFSSLTIGSELKGS